MAVLTRIQNNPYCIRGANKPPNESTTRVHYIMYAISMDVQPVLAWLKDSLS